MSRSAGKAKRGRRMQQQAKSSAARARKASTAASPRDTGVEAQADRAPLRYWTKGNLVALALGIVLQWWSTLQLVYATDEYGYPMAGDNPWVWPFMIAPTLAAGWVFLRSSLWRRFRWEWASQFKAAYAMYGVGVGVNVAGLMVALVPMGDGSTIEPSRGWRYWFDPELGPLWSSGLTLYVFLSIICSAAIVSVYPLLLLPVRLITNAEWFRQRQQRKQERIEAERLVAEAEAQARALEADAQQAFPALPSRRRPLSAPPTIEAPLATSVPRPVPAPAPAPSQSEPPPVATPAPPPLTPGAAAPVVVDDGDLDRFRPPAR